MVLSTAGCSIAPTGIERRWRIRSVRSTQRSVAALLIAPHFGDRRHAGDVGQSGAERRQRGRNGGPLRSESEATLRCMVAGERAHLAAPALHPLEDGVVVEGLRLERGARLSQARVVVGLV